jgi:hypothetical protein
MTDVAAWRICTQQKSSLPAGAPQERGHVDDGAKVGDTPGAVGEGWPEIRLDEYPSCVTQVNVV